jgi:hypothetical protein
VLDETFAESLVHRSAPWHAAARGLTGHVVLGSRLRPFSFWHACQLEICGSAFSGFDKTIDCSELLIATQICRLRYPQRPRLTGLAFRLRTRLTSLAYCRRYLRQLYAFSSYLADYNSRPVYAETENSSPVKTPWYLVAVCKLRMNAAQMGQPLTEAQAWDMPVGYGSWLTASCAEARGERVEIMTNEDREAFREAGIEGF